MLLRIINKEITMKKIIALMLALLMVFALAACGTSNVETGKPDNNETQGTELQGPTYSFTYGQTKMTMHQDAAPILAALGEPKSYTEEESCAFNGLDKTYYYGSFYLQTYPQGDADKVYCIWLVDDSVTTEEGVFIGSTQAQVSKAYGDESYNGSNAYVMKTDNCILTIILENGTVNSIQYIAVVE